MTILCEHNTPQPLCRICKEPDDRVSIPGSSLKVRPSKQEDRKPLKKSVKKRPMSPVAMTELVADVQLRDGRCVAIDHTETNCKGATQAHHLIPQRILREHYPPGHEVFAALDNCVALCQRHHSNVEAHILTLPESTLPEGFNAFLKEHGFDAWWEAQELRRVA